jgi:hypothetical protein
MPAEHVELTTVLSGTGHADCDFPVSPALYYDDATGYLYLAFQCYVGGANPAQAAALSDIVVLRSKPFAAGAVQPPNAWTWEYRGSFGGQGTAAQMQVNGIPNFVPNMVYMPDFARGPEGVLFVGTPVIHDANGDGRTGCQVLRMASIDPPVLATREGALVREAVANAPDLDPTKYTFSQQVGSCAYEPRATGIGLLLARKKPGGPLGAESSLHATGIHP